MEVNWWQCEREAMEAENEEVSIHTIVFTAGTALLMVCLKRFLVEQWRAWVFVVLNLVLIAIFFMSMRARTEKNGQEVVKNGETKKEKEEVESIDEIEEGKEYDCYKEECWGSDIESDERTEKEEVKNLSKEELNERVEAFIAMFRQHLVMDAKQAENFKFKRDSNMNMPEGLKCLVVEA